MDQYLYHICNIVAYMIHMVHKVYKIFCPVFCTTSWIFFKTDDMHKLGSPEIKVGAMVN